MRRNYNVISRIARERQLEEYQVNELITANQQQPWLGFLGTPRVNVLVLNLALDELSPGHRYPEN